MPDIIGGNVVAAVTGGVFTTEAVLQITDASFISDSPAAIIANYLATLAMVTNPSEAEDWPVYISYMPDGGNVKDDCCAVYDTAGILDGKRMDGIVNEHQGIQVKIRSKDYQTGWQKINDIARTLDVVESLSVEVIDSEKNYTVHNISRKGCIFPLGLEVEGKRRYLFTVNFAVSISEV